jgi:hypothetical protein
MIAQCSVLSPQSLFLSIADITINLFTDDLEMKLQVERATRDFLVDEPEANLTVRAAWDDLSKRTWGKKVFDSGFLWQLYHQNGSYIFCLTSPAFGSVPYKAASLDQHFNFGEVYLHRPYFNPAQPVNPLEYPLDELLITNLLARGRGVEIHACGVVDPSGDGYLFPGQSQAGKTTMARLWQVHDGITILSDDRIILRKLDGKIWMYGTPWHGDAGLACPTRAPLTTIYFLGREQENGLMPIRRTAAAAGLFACSFPPFYSREGLDFILGFLGEVTKENPCYELRFLPTEEVIDFILKNRG